MKQQVRVEIIANRSIEEDLIEILEEVGHGEELTVIHPVYGRGTSGRREASAVWPETNMILIVYLERPTAERLIAAIKALKERFPREGLRVWQIEETFRVV